MRRQEAIDVLAACRGSAISVATMQSIVPWHEAGQGEIDHLDAQRCMGSASSLGLGLALAVPDRNVLVLDGDGSLLMQLGSLVSIAHAQPRNLYHFIFANGVHETTGNQPLPGVGKFDFCVLAMGAGYQGAFSLNTKEEFEEQLPQILDTPGPVLVNLVIEGEGTRGGSAGVPMASQIKALRKSFGPEAGNSR